MPAPSDRQNSLDTSRDEYPTADADADDGNYPQALSGRHPPPRRVSFSRSTRLPKSKAAGDTTPLATPSLGGGGVPLGERIQSIPESVARISVAIPTGLPQPEASPLPVVPMIVLSIVSQ
ncbi:hypothetical protein FRC08_003000 [Ceratobasidium sp. 394]|nr:hypothetical protein FRC08_003000 [Ceratobasidium sp. 394]KAG9102145.1 hypothetical protein FS749_014923 [Ceratobasidium sp. UAMH 11750]